MSSPQETRSDLNLLREVRSTRRRSPAGLPFHETVGGKVLIGLACVALICGIAAAVAIPFASASAKADSDSIGMTTTTLTTVTTTTATTTTTTSVTTTTTTSTTTTTTTSTTSTTTTTTSTTTTTTTSTTSTTTTATTTTTTTSTTTTTVPPSSSCTTTSSGVILSNNQFLYSPTNQIYAVGMRNNQFGVYNAYGYGNVTSTAIWTASQSSTPSGAYFAGQSDRNLVVYASGGGVLWAANIFISGLNAVFCLRMQDDRNLVWVDATNTTVWQTNTAIG